MKFRTIVSRIAFLLAVTGAAHAMVPDINSASMATYMCRALRKVEMRTYRALKLGWKAQDLCNSARFSLRVGDFSSITKRRMPLNA
jgi:hypothetical protein